MSEKIRITGIDFIPNPTGFGLLMSAGDTYSGKYYVLCADGFKEQDPCCSMTFENAIIFDNQVIINYLDNERPKTKTSEKETTATLQHLDDMRTIAKGLTTALCK